MRILAEFIGRNTHRPNYIVFEWYRRLAVFNIFQKSIIVINNDNKINHDNKIGVKIW